MEEELELLILLPLQPEYWDCRCAMVQGFRHVRLRASPKAGIFIWFVHHCFSQFPEQHLAQSRYSKKPSEEIVPVTLCRTGGEGSMIPSFYKKVRESATSALEASLLQSFHSFFLFPGTSAIPDHGDKNQSYPCPSAALSISRSPKSFSVPKIPVVLVEF